MALECSLIVSGPSDVGQVLVRAFPAKVWADDLKVRSGLLTVGFVEQGFHLAALARQNGYFEAESDAGPWTWEPASYVNLGFRIDKFFDREIVWRNLLTVVANVLRSGPEDLALILNGEVLLLRREHGRVERFDAGGFWQTLDSAQLPPELASV